MISTGYGFGTVYQTQIKSACKHPYSDSQCSPSPECAGLQCFEHSSSVQRRNQQVTRMLMYTNSWINLGSTQFLISRGLQGVTFCDGNTCSYTTFSISKTASNIPTGRTGSYTYWSVKLQQGPITEYRNIICQGGGQCDPQGSGQSPDPGWVLTLDKPLSFVPINGRTKYWMYKGHYESLWSIYYFSTALGGGGIGTDLLTFNVYDSPGEAGTQLNQNINSKQSLEIGPADSYPPDWNQPILRGRIIMTPINAPLAFPYNVTLLKGQSPAVIGIDVVIDADSGTNGFNLTVNGPQQIDLADLQIGSTAGNQSGQMYQAIEVDCDLISSEAKCTKIPSAMVAPQGPDGGNSTPNFTWCDDISYIKSFSIMQLLLGQDKFFRYGLISKICTKNSNNTEIYNVTAYNFSCLPPCVGTMYTYQDIAVGCLENCTLKALGIEKKCDNTYGLYENEFACNGGIYHGQPCMSTDDQGSCFDIKNPTQIGVCTSRDNMPGIFGPDLKSLPGFNRSDPGLMVHGVFYGDLHFVDWLHRGANVVWNEVAVDVAAGLGYFDILRYLIQNGCPWRDSAIQAAISRGRPKIADYLRSLRPPNGVADSICGCSRFYLHPVDIQIPRCFPHSNLECYPSSSNDPDTDISCRNGHSNYIWANSTANGRPSRCSTGSRTALVRGPQILFLGNSLRYDLKAWAGTYIGFSKRVIICSQRLPGMPPIDICSNYTLVKFGSTIDFWNFHISDPKLRVIYFPPENAAPGRISRFNFSTSRMTQSPLQDLTGLNGKSGVLFSSPVAARIGFVEIHVQNVNYRPQPVSKLNTFYLSEDQISVFALRFNDTDTSNKDIRAYITEFPLHGDLHQVLRIQKIYNKSFVSNQSYGFGKQLSCITASGDCRRTGNCDNPLKSCYYISESFVLGDPITRHEDMIEQMPNSILNETHTKIVSVSDNKLDQLCILTDRYAEDDWWAGENFCDFYAQDNVYGSCRRCMMLTQSEPSELPGGPWTGRIVLAPTYVQRHDLMKDIDAPNDPEQGGICSLDEQCRIKGNTASKSACIDWSALDESGRPAVNKNNSWLLLNPSSPGPPCKGKSDFSMCSRNTSYLWPPGYQPYSLSSSQYISKFGDPVDANSFYKLCGDQGIHQFRARYTQQVYMTGFNFHSTMPDSVRFRVLARTARRRLQNTFGVQEVTNITRISNNKHNVTMSETRISKTNRKERNQTLEFCGGNEWREVWRGSASDGRNSSGWSPSVLLGPDKSNRLMKFRFAPTNFTTAELIIEACGLMYEGPTNNDGGNPLESLEGLVLVGTKDFPMGLVSNEECRVAYIPHPHFSGNDRFSFRGEDFQNMCHGHECNIRTDLQEGISNLVVENTNDQPLAEELEITSDQDQEIIFTVNGIDASPDSTLGWTEWGYLGQGAGASSRAGVGPAAYFYFKTLESDPFGSYDNEPDSLLISTIIQYPDRGVLTQLGERAYRYTPPKGAGGRPLTNILYTLKDQQGIVSNVSSITINVLCNAGFFIHQSLRVCVACPAGFYKQLKSDATSCFVCDSGKYTVGTGSTSCLACSTGTFAAEPGSISCKSCRPGTFANSTGMKMCRSCPSGSFAPRPFATACTNCGPLSYAPLPGSSRCYDCPSLSRSSKLASNSAKNCICIYDSYRKSSFEIKVMQQWSPDGKGAKNGSLVAPGVPAIDKPWPSRLDQISSNCTPCPEGAFCYGRNLYPVSKIGYWTDSSEAKNGFWPNYVSPKFYKCTARNIREVCLGYPLFDQQEQIEICKHRKHYRACSRWPIFNYTILPDPARCKAGYEGVICSKCISHKLQQCVPLKSDKDDGWFSWRFFAKFRGEMASYDVNVSDCYRIGECNPNTDEATCMRRKDECSANSAICRWDSAIYYRNFAGFCLPCPLGAAEGFIIYIAWFAIYGSTVFFFVFFYLTDMKSFAITVTFFQTAALIGRFQLPWPTFALSLISVYSFANVNLEALPWKCFFGVSPSYRELWYLTIFVPAALMGGTIVWWIFPFIVVPHRGKIALKAFKKTIDRRDYLKGTGPFPRLQYTNSRSVSGSSRQSLVDTRSDLDSKPVSARKATECLDITDDVCASSEAAMDDDEIALGTKTSLIKPTIAWGDIQSGSMGQGTRLTSPTKIEKDMILEEAASDGATIAGSKFGSQVESLETRLAERNHRRQDCAAFSRLDIGKAQISRAARCNVESKKCSQDGGGVFRKDIDISTLPGSSINYDRVFAFDDPLFHIQVAGKLFGSKIGEVDTSLPRRQSSEKQKTGLFLYRGKAAVDAIENDGQEKNRKMSPNRNNETRKPAVLEFKDSMSLTCATPHTDILTEPNSSKRKLDLMDGRHLKCRDDTCLSETSQLKRKEEGYREWSTQNITQSYVPRMDELLDTARSSASSDEVSKPLGLPWYARRQYIDLAWRNCVGILDMMFIMAGCKTLEVFQWSKWTESKIVLDVDPNLDAFSKMHAEILPVALLVLPFYVGSPVISNVFISYGWKKRIMDEQSFAMRWGFLLDPFERRYWFWNIIVSLRKLSFIISVVFLQGSKFLQVFFPLIVVLLNVIANCKYRPYRIERHNILENILLIGVVFMMIAGLMTPGDIVLYHDTNGRKKQGPYDIPIILCIMSVQFLTLIAILICIHSDILEAQIFLPRFILWPYRLFTFPLHLCFLALKNGIYAFGLVFAYNKRTVKETSSDKPKVKHSQFQSATAFNRAVQGDPPVVTGARLADILWDTVMKMKKKQEPSVLQSFEDHGNLVRPDDNASWLRDKFAIQKRIFILERKLQVDCTFDKRSTNILRVERMLSTALDAAIEYHQRERDHFFDLLYDAETEQQLLTKDFIEAHEKLVKEEEILSKITVETNFSRVKLDAEIRRIGMPEEWRRRFLEQQAKRYALEQEIVDLQSQVDKIKLVPGGVWGGSEAAAGSEKDS